MGSYSNESNAPYASGVAVTKSDETVSRCAVACTSAARVM